MQTASPSRRFDRPLVSAHRENARQRSRRIGPIALALCLCAIVVAGTLGMHAAFADTTPYTGHWTRAAATDDIPAADESAGIATYQSQYGFFAPHAASIANVELTRLAVLVPYARVATARINSRYGAHVQPEMVLWWTHADGIRANVNYSNCANEADQYFSHIHNCDKPWFWQLGAAADQFSYVVYLPLAVDDMYGVGASENAALIQRLGQHVLDFDQHVGTTPACGGYSCTYPSTTISQLMQTVSLQAQTDGNWYASLLMRDPGIGSWMTARALRSFSRDQTKGWVGCYYAASCWQRLSDRMGDILSAWPQLVQTAQALGPGDPVNPTATATATPINTATPTPTATDTPTPTPTPTDTATPTETAIPTDTPTNTPSATATDTPPFTPVAPIPCRLPVSGIPFAMTSGAAAGTSGVAENTPCFYGS